MYDIFTSFIIQLVLWAIIFLFTVRLTRKNAALKNRIEALIKNNFEKKTTGAR
ncbi:MAG: hypothetical protein ACT4NX_04935 [Deltaproteobacteria bacterium]